MGPQPTMRTSVVSIASFEVIVAVIKSETILTIKYPEPDNRMTVGLDFGESERGVEAQEL